MPPPLPNRTHPQMVYAWKNASFGSGRVQLDNFGGLWVGDRTLSNKTSKFVPTPDNIVFLPNATQLQAAGVVSASCFPRSGNGGTQGPLGGMAARVVTTAPCTT